jgi:putative membrane protein
VKKLLLLGTAVAAGVLIKRWLETPRLPVVEVERLPRSRALVHGEPVFGVVKVGGADEALGILARFDEHQIACAEAARERDLDDATLGMAERLRKEHSDRLEETNARAEERSAEPEQFGSVAHFDTRCNERLEELVGLPDAGFAGEYLERVADEHAAMLRLIDDALLPDVADPIVRELLRRHRKHLASHLADARMLH